MPGETDMLIKANTYIMYCANCYNNEDSFIKEILSKEVLVTMDLYSNKYIFISTCPTCLADLKITRDIK